MLHLQQFLLYFLLCNRSAENLQERNPLNLPLCNLVRRPVQYSVNDCNFKTTRPSLRSPEVCSFTRALFGTISFHFIIKLDVLMATSILTNKTTASKIVTAGKMFVPHVIGHVVFEKYLHVWGWPLHLHRSLQSTFESMP